MNARQQLLVLTIAIITLHSCKKQTGLSPTNQIVNNETISAPVGGNYWQARAFFTAPRTAAVSFAINGKGYLFGGYQGGQFRKDLWEYNTSSDTWTQKASLPLLSKGRMSSAAFVINNKGYVVGGDIEYTPANGYQTAETWGYDPAVNTWIQRASIPVGRGRATGFAINGKGYIAFGSNESVDLFMDEVLEYDPAANTWTSISHLTAPNKDLGRYQAVSFVINNKAYMGTGFGPSGTNFCLKDFWEFDPATLVWTQKADFGPGARAAAVGFGSGSLGYVGTGYFIESGVNYNMNDFWSYSAGSNIWTKKANFPGYGRYGASGFYVGGRGWLGHGYRPNYYSTNDFYRYSPSTSIISPSIN